VRHLSRLVCCGAGAVILVLAGCSGGGGGMATPASGVAVQQDGVGMQPTSGLKIVSQRVVYEQESKN
jgi:hypothetical protein